MSDNTTSEWTETYPTEPGWYWMYAVSKPGKGSPRLSAARVKRNPNTTFIVADGQLIYREEQERWYAKVFWRPMENVPEPPSVEPLKIA